jgi:dCTP deaminase
MAGSAIAPAMAAAATAKGEGILPDGAIRGLIAAGHIDLAEPAAPGQLQPASLDLRLGAKATRVRASFLPGPEFSVTEKLSQLALHEFDITGGAVLETSCVYIVPLLESLDLPADIAASANPKSSTGRLDIFTRVITDQARAFDQMPEGYCGPLYLEVSPRTFPILVRKGSRLSQIRFRRGNAVLDDAALAELHASDVLASGSPRFINGLALSIDLNGDLGGGRGGLVGYRAKRYTGVIDVDRVGAYDVADFWEPIRRGERPEIVLDPAQFYILVSGEAVHVPPGYAAEMVPFDPLVGEFRVHYAGFFDPGFGHGPAGGHGSRAVLEVRSHEVPFILEHGQTIGRLVYEPLAAPPENLYGAALGSNYQAQGLKLSKHFRAAAAPAALKTP